VSEKQSDSVQHIVGIITPEAKDRRVGKSCPSKIEMCFEFEQTLLQCGCETDRVLVGHQLGTMRPRSTCVH
jgi:hypothetical protein